MTTIQKTNLGMILLTLVSLILPIGSVSAEEAMVLFHESFVSLNDWKPLTFPKIESHSEYLIEKDAGGHVLKAISRASASGLIYKKAFNIREYPILRWKWKVSTVLKRGNSFSKEGDDYPIRIYIIFKYDPSSASLTMRAMYRLVKSIYREYPPHSSLIYIWANQSQAQRIIPSPYTDRAMMIVLQAGKEKLRKWIEEEVDILSDYRAAFGKEPPPEASLAIMSDTDNTGESATAWINFIEVRK